MGRFDDGTIKTGQLGCAVAFVSPTINDLWTVKFDTGVILYVPRCMFQCMDFKLDDVEETLKETNRPLP